MTCEQQLKRFHTDDIHYSDLGIAPDWLKQISLATGPIRSITQNQVVTQHQYGISAVIAQTSLCRKTGSGVAKCLLFSLALW